MAEARQQQNAGASPEQHTQPQAQPSTGQSSQELQRRSGGSQTGLAPRRGFLPSLFTMDPFDMMRSSPFALMRRFSEEMDQWFAQQGLGRGGHSMVAGGELFAPAVEVFEREGTFVVRADLPGLTKDDVRVEVTDAALVLEGERRSEHDDQQGGVVHSERHYGMFRRQIPLPEGINAEQATATFKDGVLEVTMPAPQRQARGRRIAIQGASESPSPQGLSGNGHEAAPSTKSEPVSPSEQRAS
jgi:HSP20 family protein